MSWWTDFRDTIQSIGTVVMNYYYPGSGPLVNALHSKGSQEQMSSFLGQAAMMGSGVFGGASGNMANYGNTLNAISGSGGATTGAGFSTGEAVSGFYGGSNPETIDVARQMIANGASPAEAIQVAGISPQAAEQAGLTAGAGQTWFDVSQQIGIPYSSGAGTSVAGMNPAGGPGGVGPGPAANTAASAGAMPWGSPGNLSTMGSGLYGLSEAMRMRSLAEQAGAKADPFGPYRQQYADQMSALSADPSLITKQPGYEAGLQAIKRTMASQGYTGSGNMMAALSKYGGDFYNQTMNNYANWGGAGFNPANAAQLGLQGQQYGIDLAGRSLGTLGYGIRSAGG